MKNVSLTTILIDNQSIQTVIEGELVIREAAAIKENLLNLLKNYQSIELKFKEIDKLDVSALQLLIAIHKSATTQQKNITFHFEDSEYIKSVLNNSGYNIFFTAS
jgi:ABC-type transporter Mla MlaB component